MYAKYVNYKGVAWAFKSENIGWFNILDFATKNYMTVCRFFEAGL